MDVSDGRLRVAGNDSWRAEFGHVIRLALPVVIAQVGSMLLGVVDTMMVGRVGKEALAAVDDWLAASIVENDHATGMTGKGWNLK